MSVQGASRIAEGSSESLFAALEALQGRVAQRLMTLASSLRTDEDGKLIMDEGNLRRISEIIAEAKASFIDEPFVDALATYLESFDLITGEVIEGFDDFDGLDEDQLALVNTTYKQTLAEDLTNPERYSIWGQLSNDLLFGVAASSVLADVLIAISDRMNAGAVTAPVEQDVYTAPITLGRAATQVAGEQTGTQFYFYQGRSIDTTRPFPCGVMAGHAWHIEEIRDLGRRAAAGEDLDGNGKPGWAGMVEGTNEHNIMQHLGGWYGKRNSCRHVLVPIAIDEVPEQDYNRMRKLGLVE